MLFVICLVAPISSEGPLPLGSNRLVATTIATTIARLSAISMTVLFRNLLRLTLVVLQLSLPHSIPITHILSRTIHTPLRQPESKHHKTTPEGDVESQSHPEEHALHQHVDKFERDVEDDEHEGDLCQVGLLEQGLEGREEVVVEDVVEGREGTEEVWGEVAMAEEVAGPVCVGMFVSSGGIRM